MKLILESTRDDFQIYLDEDYENQRLRLLITVAYPPIQDRDFIAVPTADDHYPIFVKNHDALQKGSGSWVFMGKVAHSKTEASDLSLKHARSLIQRLKDREYPTATIEDKTLESS